MLLKYPAGSTLGSGAFGMSILGITGGGILGYPGVVGDFNDEVEDWPSDEVSAREEEFFREEIEEEVLSLRVKIPMIAFV